MRNEPMYGWRCRIGRLTPSSALEGIEEWRRWAPDGVCIMPSLISLPGNIVHKDMAYMLSTVERAATDVRDALVDVVIQCCAPGTFTQGYEMDETVISMLKQITGKPSTTMQAATIDAMKELGFRRIAVATAYRDELNIDLKTCLEQAGFEIASMTGLNVLDPKTLPFIGPEEAYRIIMKARNMAEGEIDGVLFSGGGLRTFEIIEAAERDTGVPVVTGGQAGFWRSLRLAGIVDIIPDLGTLFRH